MSTVRFMLNPDFELDYVGLSIWVSFLIHSKMVEKNCQTHSLAEGISFERSRITSYTCESILATANVIGLVAGVLVLRSSGVGLECSGSY